MFGTLIDINTDGNILMHDKGVALLPCMFEVYKDKHLGSKAVKWIVAMYDYSSPYRSLPKEDRENTVNYVILDKENCSFKNKEKVKKAIEEYKKVSYDADFEEYRAMVDKSAEAIKVFRDMKVTKDNLKLVNDLQVEMGKSAESRRKLKKAIIDEMESGNKMAGIDSDDDLSLFEKDEMYKRK